MRSSELSGWAPMLLPGVEVPEKDRCRDVENGGLPAFERLQFDREAEALRQAGDAMALLLAALPVTQPWWRRPAPAFERQPSR